MFKCGQPSPSGRGRWRLAIFELADIPRLSKAGWLCASKIPEMRTGGAVGKVAKPHYRFPRSAPNGIKEASLPFTNRPVCANKDAARHFILMAQPPRLGKAGNGLPQHCSGVGQNGQTPEPSPSGRGLSAPETMFEFVGT